MQKRHFEAAADLVRCILDGKWTNDLPTWALERDPIHGGRLKNLEIEAESAGNLCPHYVRAVWTAEAFISLFGSYNPRFDDRRFLIACGLVADIATPKKRKVA